MKGYYVSSGYMGYIPSQDKFILFSTEKEYEDYLGKED